MEDQRHHLRAFGFHRACALRSAGRRLSASLLDMGRGGLRLRLEADARSAPALGTRVAVELAPRSDASLDMPLCGVVRWRSGDLLGVLFDAPLSLGTAELLTRLAPFNTAELFQH